MADQETYKFSRKFQINLVNVLVRNGAELVAEGAIRPEYFDDPYLAKIVDVVLSLYDDIGLDLTFDIVENYLRERHSVSDLLSLTNAIKSVREDVHPTEEAVVVQQALRFARHQVFKSTLRSSIDLLRSDDLEELTKQWERALAFGQNVTHGRGTYYFSDVSDRLRRRTTKPDVLPSLIPELDSVLFDGGFGRREIAVFLGLPSSGKSFALGHIAKVSVIQKKKVVFYTLEMSSERVMSRFDASFAGVETRELRENSQKVSRQLEKMSTMFGDNLLIKEFPAGIASVSTLKAHIATLRMSGFVPDVVCLDYINLLAPPSRVDRRYEGLGQVYVDLIGLAKEYNLWMFTAAQSNRTGFESNLITMQTISESFQGAMHCLVGSTRIDCPRDLVRYPDGIPIKDLVGKEFHTYSWSKKKGRFVLRKARNVCKTGRKAEVWKVTWYDGYNKKYGELVGTPNHRVMLRSGKYKQLKDLKPGDSLKVLRRAIHNRKPYQSIVATPGKYTSEHRFIYQELHGNLPTGENVHHENGNIYDNGVSNLHRMNHSEHISHHHKGKVTSEETKRKISESEKGKTISAEHRKALSLANTGKGNPMYGRQHTEQAKESIRQKKTGKSLPEGTRIKMSRTHKKRWRARKAAMSNHKVVSVEFYGYEDVYDMEVEKTHNFVANEIVVHNSDVIISLNRDDEEANREYIRLYIAKDRNGVDKKVISGYTNFSRGAFWKRN